MLNVIRSADIWRWPLSIQFVSDMWHQQLCELCLATFWLFPAHIIKCDYIIIIILIIPCSPFSLCLPIRVTLHNLQRSVLQLFLACSFRWSKCVLSFLVSFPSLGQNWSTLCCTLCCIFQTFVKCWPKPPTNDRILEDDDPNVLYSLHYWKQI